MALTSISNAETDFRCTQCGNGLTLEGGTLFCSRCDSRYPIVGGIPRFVDESHYAGSFGFEWQHHAHTQYDSISGCGISRKRLFKETAWPEQMRGEKILEAGCGGGRFTEHLVRTGATVFSIDASTAVEENYRFNGRHDNVQIAQADLNRLPFAERSFDRVLCIGVLQHTPDPYASLKALSKMVKSGGSLVVDFYDRPVWYKRIFITRYWIRPLTKRLPPALLYRLVRGYVRGMWPVVTLIHRLPHGKKINHKLLIAEYLSYECLKPEMQVEWAILDTFDWLSPRFEYPQTIETVRAWCATLPLKNVDVQFGYGGIQMRAVGD